MPIRARHLAGILCLLSAVALSYVTHLDGEDRRPYTETYQFSRGKTFVNGEENRLKALGIDLLANRHHAVVIVGHTGVGSDDGANRLLSISRAKATKEVLLDAGLPADRIITVEGLGASQPLQRQPGETERGYQRRLSRVDVKVIYRE